LDYPAYLSGSRSHGEQCIAVPKEAAHRNYG
jgi:hypothetical protein